MEKRSVRRVRSFHTNRCTFSMMKTMMIIKPQSFAWLLVAMCIHKYTNIHNIYIIYGNPPSETHEMLPIPIFLYISFFCCCCYFSFSLAFSFFFYDTNAHKQYMFVAVVHCACNIGFVRRMHFSTSHCMMVMMTMIIIWCHTILVWMKLLGSG